MAKTELGKKVTRLIKKGEALFIALKELRKEIEQQEKSKEG